MSDLNTKMAEAIRAFSVEEELRALREVKLPDDFEKQVLAQLRVEEPVEKRSGANNLIQLFQSFRPVLAVAAAVLIFAIATISIMRSNSTELAMSFPPLKGGNPTEAGTLVDASVVVSLNWEKQSLQVPLKAGGELTGQFKPATNAAPLPLAYDVNLAGMSAGQSVNGTGQLLIMPQDPSDKLGRFSTNALLWVKLDLKLRADGKEEPLYRVFGAP